MSDVFIDLFLILVAAGCFAAWMNNILAGIALMAVLVIFKRK